MAIRTEKFELGKEVSVKAINEFFRVNRLDRTQVLSVGVVQKSQNAAVYLVTYEDVKAPYVVSTSPGNGFTDVPLISDIVILMSEAVTTVQWTNTSSTDIEVRRDGVLVDPVAEGGSVTPLAGSWPSSGFSINNAIDDTAGAVYQVTLKTTIADSNGNTMELPYVFIFTAIGQLAGMTFKSGRLTPNVQQIGSGYADISFLTPFPSNNYRLADSFWSDIPIENAPITGCPLRWDAHSTSGARCYFDFPFPTGAMIEWLAYYGAEDTTTP